MTHTIRLSILATSMALLSACAPLQQAPLLYSSKMSVGLDVSMATSETPGGSISIGYKNVDAAYVPVAVSKDTINKNGTLNHSYDIVKIEAIYGEGATSAKVDQQTEERKYSINEYLSAKSKELTIEGKIAELTQQIATIKSTLEKNKGLKKIAESTSAAAPESAVAPPTAVNYEKLISEGESELKIKETQQATENTNLTYAKAESAKLFAKAAEAASLLRTDKRDAMSVYGRFNSQGEGSLGSSNAKANLTAGKIFSTGVASQNLTEAAKFEAAQSGIVDCINSVKDIVGSSPLGATEDDKIKLRDKLLATLMTVCKPIEKDNAIKK